MYAKIKGILSDITSSNVTLMASGTGIGFDLLLSPLAYSLASQVGEGGECEMKIYHHRTEVSELLFAFGSAEEKALFLTLLKVSGIGAKTALSILSLGVDTIIQAIESGDDKTLASVSGLGKKGALKIIVELKGAVKNYDNLDTQKKSSSLKNSGVIQTPHQEAFAALIGLGYDRSRVEIALSEMDEGSSLDDIIKGAIAKLSYRG
ncbi:MAG: Holliday junction branch migration protein RuvA [Candidatus Gracilibacteria bacterium]